MASIVFASDGIGGHIIEKSDGNLSPVQPHGQSNAQLLVARVGMPLAQACRSELTHGARERDGDRQSLVRFARTQKLDVASGLARRGIEHRLILPAAEPEATAPRCPAMSRQRKSQKVQRPRRDLNL